MMRRLASLMLFAAVAGSASARQPTLGTEDQREAGRKLYNQVCSQCHGEKGDGQGPASAYLIPPARNFIQGKYKVRTTPNGELPTDDDLRRIIKDGMPYTAMPPWPELSDDEIDALVYYLKTFTPDFADPAYLIDPMDLGNPPPVTEASILYGKEVYKKADCGRCHGPAGRGGGKSAPTLKDDDGNPIKPADLTQPWTFRGGHARTDLFRTISAAFNGTPMPDFAKSLPEADRWAMADYVVSLWSSGRPQYGTLIEAIKIDKTFEMDQIDSLLETAPPTRFPLLGQIIEPGRSFAWPVTSLEAQAIYNNEEMVIRLIWNDMSGEETTANDPTMKVPSFLDELPNRNGETQPEGETDEEDFWGEAATEEEAAPSAEDFWGEDLAEESDEEVGEEAGEEDFWGEDLAVESDSQNEEEDADDFWGEEVQPSAAAQEGAGPKFIEEFSDAVAIQFPSVLPEGSRLPYFLFGDKANPVDLWYVDLATKKSVRFVGRGSDSLIRQEGEPVEVAAQYREGRWTVTFKRRLRAMDEFSIEAGRFIPIAFSVWDGFQRERGSKRGLTSWFSLYLKPPLAETPLEASAKAVLMALVLEIIVIAIIRRKYPNGEIAERSNGSDS